MLHRVLSRLRRIDLDKTAQAAAEHWDRESQIRTVYWTEPVVVRDYVNELVTGVPWLSPTQALKAGWAYRPLGRGLSIGCGTGPLERDIWRQRICKRIEATDVSEASLATARRLAAREGMRGITYRRESFNQLKLRPDRYDIVFFHGSLHHVSDPDACLDEVEKGLKPDGFLYIDEYVGPSRDEWQDKHLRYVRQEYDRVDEDLRRFPVVPPIAPGDPSEMIRSSRILPAIEERFEIVHYRPYWGNLLYPLFCMLDSGRLIQPEHRDLLERWIEREKKLVHAGDISSPLYAVVLARKR